MVPALLLAFAMQPDAPMLRRLFEDALAQKRQAYGEKDARTAQAARDLGLFLARHGEPEAAQPVLREAVAIADAVFGNAASPTLSDVAELAAILPATQAEPLWERAAAAEDAGIAARALGSMGDLRRADGDAAGAAGLYRKALAKQEHATGAESEPVAVRLNALAPLVELKEGIALLERALAIDRRALGPRHPQTATTEANLAGLLINARRNDDAIRLAGDALSIFQETLGADHPRCAVAAGMLGFALSENGDAVRAERMYRLAVGIDERAYGASHPQTIRDIRELVEFLRLVGKEREAAEWEKKIPR